MRIFLFSLTIFFTSLSFGQEFSFSWRQLYNKNLDYQILKTLVVQDTVYTFGVIHYAGFASESPPFLPVDVSPGTSDLLISPQYGTTYRGTIVIGKSLLNGTFLGAKKLLETDFCCLITRFYVTNHGDIILYGSANYYNTEVSLVDFDPSPSNVPDSIQNYDRFTYVACYNSNGEFQNRIIYKSSLPLQSPFNYLNFIDISDITVSDQNELFIHGNFHGTIDADFTSGVDSISFTSPGIGLNPPNHQFLIKADLNNYSYTWSKVYGGGGGNSSAGMIKCNNDIVVLTGGFWETDFDMDPSPATVIQNNPSGLFAVYVSKLNSNTGDFINGFSLVGTPNTASSSPPGSTVSTYGLALDDQSNIYLEGYTNANQYIPLDLDPGPGTEILAYYGAGNIFLAKYNPSNQLLWSSYLYSGYGNIYPSLTGTSLNLKGSVLTMGLNLGLCTLYGSMNAPDTLLFAPNNKSTFIGAYDATTGQLIDHHELMISQSAGDVRLNDITMDRYKNCYIVFDYRKIIDFNQFDSNYQPDSSYNHITGSGPYFEYSKALVRFNWDEGLGMKQLTSVNDLLVYPNPVLNTLTIRAESNILAYRVYAPNGRLIKEVENLNSLQITEPFESVSSGIYLIQAETQNGPATSRIVKQ